ncbi:MAG: molybdenum cofactor biosynthesis protein MoaE [Acidimicrobiales bacterium]
MTIAIDTSAPLSPPDGSTWLALTSESLPVQSVSDWVILPSCGAVVVFSGTARDNSTGRPEVSRLEYEAYDLEVVPRLEAIEQEMRTQWSAVGRIAMLHRIGVVPVGESSVLVAVSSPHRVEAFEAARYGIDTLKATLPVWKRETWRDGESWALESQPITDLEDL